MKLLLPIRTVIPPPSDSSCFLTSDPSLLATAPFWLPYSAKMRQFCKELRNVAESLV